MDESSKPASRIELIRPGTHQLDMVLKDLNSEEWEDQDEKYTLENLRKFTSNPDNFLLIAYSSGQMAGVLEAYNLQKLDARGKEMLLYSIETKRSFRQQGIGKALILRLKKIASRQGSHEIWVLTDNDNIPANKLYSSLGIKTIPSSQIMYNYPLPSALENPSK